MRLNSTQALKTLKFGETMDNQLRLKPRNTDDAAYLKDNLSENDISFLEKNREFLNPIEK